MAIRIDKNIPAPAGRSSGSRNPSEISDAIKSLLPGDSFFVAADDCKPPILQRRITVRSVSLRESGAIGFFLTTRQTEENWTDDEGVVHEKTPGVRVWRREKVELTEPSTDTTDPTLPMGENGNSLSDPVDMTAEELPQ